MPVLQSIHISGFRSIRGADLELRPLNILLGANGAGKSNLLGLLRLLRDALEGRLQYHVGQQGGADNLLHHGAKRTQRIAITISLTGSAASRYTLQLDFAATGGLFVSGEDITLAPEDGVSSIELGGGGKESLLAHPPIPPITLDDAAAANLKMAAKDALNTLQTAALEIKATCQGMSIYHFNDTSPAAPIRQSCDLRDNRSLHADGRNLPALLYRIRQTAPHAYEKIRDTVRLVAPYFDDFDLRPRPENPRQILLEWRERGSDKYFDVSHLSDGTLRFICLATLFLQPEASPMVLIDEPELGLHPFAIGVLAGLLRSAAQRMQIMVATQSVTLVDEFEDPADVVVTERQGGASVFHRLDSDALAVWLEDYSLGELWQKGVPEFGGRPRP